MPQLMNYAVPDTAPWRVLWEEKDGRSPRAFFAGEQSPLTMDLAPARDIPTITDIAFDSYGSSALVSGDSRITYYGSRNMVHMNTWESRSRAVTGEVNTPYFLEFGTDAPNFKMRLSTSSEKNQYLMWVDDRLVFPDYQTLTEGQRSVTFTFPAGRSRKITLLSAWGQGQITFPNDYNAWKIDRPRGRKMLMMTDSWGKAGTAGLDGIVYWLGMRLGYTDIHMSASGGTGLVANNAGSPRKNYQDRFELDVVAAAPNDLSSTDNEVYLAAKKLFATAAELLPDTRVFCSGVQWVTSGADAQRDALDAALSAACQQSKNVKAFISTKGWLIGTGTAGGTNSGIAFSNTDFCVPRTEIIWNRRWDISIGRCEWRMLISDRVSDPNPCPSTTAVSPSSNNWRSFAPS